MTQAPSTRWKERIAPDEQVRYEQAAQQIVAIQRQRSERFGTGRALHRKRITAAHGELTVAAGLPRQDLVLDPGLGFAKNARQSLELCARLDELCALGFPVLIGASRKGFIGRLTGVQRPEDRVAGSLGAALAAAALGADLLRVHDVKATRDALVVYAACTSGG